MPIATSTKQNDTSSTEKKSSIVPYSDGTSVQPLHPTQWQQHEKVMSASTAVENFVVSVYVDFNTYCLGPRHKRVALQLNFIESFHVALMQNQT